MADTARILLVSHTGNYPVDVGGPQAVAHYVSLNLAKMGMHVTLYQRFASVTNRHTWEETPEAQALREAGVETVALIADYSLRNLWKYPYYTFSSPRALDHARYDLVHYNSPPVDANILLPRMFHSKHTPQTLTIHGGLFYESRNVVGRVTLRLQAKYFRRAVALNGFSKSVALEHGFAEQKICVIPNGVDVELVDRVEPVELGGEPSVFYAGRLEPIKGIRTLLEATQIAAQKLGGLRLYIAGEGSLRGEVERFSEIHPQTMRYLGRLPSVRDVMAAAKGASMVVIPSLKENFSIMLLETMAAGTPLVVSDAEGNTSVVDEECAWIFERGSAQSLAQKIVEAHLDQEASKRKAENARVRAHQEYSWPNIAQRYLELFRSFQVR